MVYAIIFCVRISNLVFIHPVVWYGTNISQTAMRSRLHFNPLPPYGMRRLLQLLRCSGLYISIHAPTKGATQNDICSSLSPADFNPRTHKGCDISVSAADFSIPISIHAPTKGATAKLLKISPIFITILLLLYLFSNYFPKSLTIYD